MSSWNHTSIAERRRRHITVLTTANADTADNKVVQHWLGRHARGRIERLEGIRPQRQPEVRAFASRPAEDMTHKELIDVVKWYQQRKVS